MNILLCYPKIPRLAKARDKGILEGECVAFEKYDGTNMHWVSPGGSDGFSAFGTRRNRFPFSAQGQAEFHVYNTLGHLRHAPTLFRSLAPALHIRERTETILFTEYLGLGSFNGQHPAHAGANFRHVLIDIELDGTLLAPDHFLAMAVEIGWPSNDIARVVWRGRAKHCGAFLHDVHEGKLDVVEGVVVKTSRGMFKAKTDTWEQKLAASRAS